MRDQVLSRAKLRIYNVDQRLQLAGMRGGHEVNIILRGTVSLSRGTAAKDHKVHIRPGLTAIEDKAASSPIRPAGRGNLQCDAQLSTSYTSSEPN